jgi:hypothetical protein
VLVDRGVAGGPVQRTHNESLERGARTLTLGQSPTQGIVPVTAGPSFAWGQPEPNLRPDTPRSSEGVRQTAPIDSTSHSVEPGTKSLIHGPRYVGLFD